MVRRHITVLRLSLMAADALTAAALFVFVSILRFGEGWLAAWVFVGVPTPVGMAIWAASWVLIVWVHGLYRLRAHWSARAEASVLLRATLLAGIGVFTVLFAVQLPQVSRLFLVELLGIQLAVTLAARLVIRRVFEIARRRGMNTRNMLIVGTSPDAVAFANRIEGHRELGLRVIGHLAEAPASSGGWATGGRPILGTFEDIDEVLHDRVVDEVAVCLPPSEWRELEILTRVAADEGKVVRVPGDDSMPRLPHASVEDFDGLVLQSLVHGPDRSLSLLAKRAMDVAGALLLILLLSPILGLTALAIGLSEGRPILFRQTRVGLHGRRFGLYKFRTMVPDAEQQLATLLALNQVDGAAFKLDHDPRVTRVGRVLRRTSLDELPQLWNVLRGEMSLVGPRPPLPREVEGYDVWHRRRLSMKPGITGLWQISARRHPDFDRWVSIDLDYIDSWSLWLDVKIIVRTLPAMLEGR